jgi:hypothetical protein
VICILLEQAGDRHPVNTWKQAMLASHWYGVDNDDPE